MKHIAAVAIATLTFGCTDVTSPTDQPQMTSYEASGLPRAAFVGATNKSNSADLIFEPAQTTAVQVSAAPEKVCIHLGGTVLSVENIPHPSPQYYPTARILKIKCAT